MVAGFVFEKSALLIRVLFPPTPGDHRSRRTTAIPVAERTVYSIAPVPRNSAIFHQIPHNSVCNQLQINGSFQKHPRNFSQKKFPLHVPASRPVGGLPRLSRPKCPARKSGTKSELAPGTAHTTRINRLLSSCNRLQIRVVHLNPLKKISEWITPAPRRFSPGVNCTLSAESTHSKVAVCGPVAFHRHHESPDDSAAR